MIFKERQKRAMDTMNHRNKEYLEKMNGPLPDGGEENQEIPVRQVDDNHFSFAHLFTHYSCYSAYYDRFDKVAIIKQKLRQAPYGSLPFAMCK